jgi:dynein heavy chain, axonemal
MNYLVKDIFTSINELDLGLQGALNMTDAMESLQISLMLNRVPDGWAKYYASKKPLASWYNDLKLRYEQLMEWTKDMVMPKSICISYLFNPMSFLTAIM